MIQGRFILSANVRDHQQTLASGVAPAREADQQVTCQKSRRDGCLVDRLVRSVSFELESPGKLWHSVVFKKRRPRRKGK